MTKCDRKNNHTRASTLYRYSEYFLLLYRMMMTPTSHHLHRVSMALATHWFNLYKNHHRKYISNTNVARRRTSRMLHLRDAAVSFVRRHQHHHHRHHHHQQQQLQTTTTIVRIILMPIRNKGLDHSQQNVTSDYSHPLSSDLTISP